MGPDLSTGSVDRGSDAWAEYDMATTILFMVQEAHTVIGLITVLVKCGI